MSESKHTPGPMTIELTGVYGGDDKVMVLHSNPDDFQVIRTLGRLWCYDTKETNIANQKRVAKCWNSHDALLAACKAQHDAIDILFAMLVAKDEKFFPSKSGRPWDAIQQGNTATAEAEKGD